MSGGKIPHLLIQGREAVAFLSFPLTCGRVSMLGMYICFNCMK